MDNCCNAKIQNSSSVDKWEFINMSDEEEDIICRMHKLVGDKWELIAGRIPGRTATEIERFWLMRNDEDSLKSKTIEQQIRRRS